MCTDKASYHDVSILNVISYVFVHEDFDEIYLMLKAYSRSSLSGGSKTPALDIYAFLETKILHANHFCNFE